MAYSQICVTQLITLFFMVTFFLTFSRASPLLHDRQLIPSSLFGGGKSPFLYGNSQQATNANGNSANAHNAEVQANNANEASKSLDTNHANTFMINKRQLGQLGKGLAYLTNAGETKASSNNANAQNVEAQANNANECSSSYGNNHANNFVINKRRLGTGKGLAYLSNAGETKYNNNQANTQNAQVQANNAHEHNFNIDSASSGTSMFGKRMNIKQPFLYASNNAENHAHEQAASMNNLAANVNDANMGSYNLQNQNAATKMLNKRDSLE
ncbi:1101_t:CDS:1 [Acaulospora colombiana]|uniref:1101_t:CDS:1 n=1 Tax=Acaulospora colombiana TaxID=27376 RepID=A0ACA9NCY6_9GLOM|nr:1101_t:CDS:1 [Acaulospora colombiana]